MPYWFDGNNLIGQSTSAAAADRKTRRAFLTRLSGYATGRAGRLVVFFDGDDPERTLPPRGVQVHYSAPLSTDDAILGRLKGVRSASDIIVVTNDRALTAGCRFSGAKTMSWETFSNAMKSRSEKRPLPSGDQDKVNMEEWIEFFDLDKNSLE